MGATMGQWAPMKELETVSVPKLAYSTREAAQSLGVSEVTIYRLLARNKLRAVGALRHKLIPAGELQRFLTAETQEVA